MLNFWNVFSARKKKAAPAAPSDRRGAPRLPASFAVHSPRLQARRCLATNISRSGLGLTTGEPLGTGEHLPLLLNFDDERFPVVSIRGEVAWCRPASQRTYAIGIRFVQEDDRTARQIHLYIRSVESLRRQYA